jgi:hypothetical protein
VTGGEVVEAGEELFVHYLMVGFVDERARIWTLFGGDIPLNVNFITCAQQDN